VRRKKGVHGGNMVSPVLINDPEYALAMADTLHEHYESWVAQREKVAT
jgi:hypothetical protein